MDGTYRNVACLYLLRFILKGLEVAGYVWHTCFLINIIL